jgi:hypothetical protein
MSKLLSEAQGMIRAGAGLDPGLGVVHEHERLRRRLPGASPLGLTYLVLYLLLWGSWHVLLGEAHPFLQVRVGMLNNCIKVFIDSCAIR